MPSTLIETQFGRVQGSQEGAVFVWRGIPYARPPVQELRFLPPQPLEPCPGIREATRFGNICVQEPNMLGGAEGFVQSEDCLYLNIWSPGVDGKPRPVMVWIHGGGFVFGSGQVSWYDGTSFATEGDVVLVTINYRLGPFGFLQLDDIFGAEYAASGNCGLLDQVAALQWVHDNIAAFGGDPDKVTVFGESAGSMSIGALLAMPAAKGLFHQAMMQSGLPIPMRSMDTARQTARHVLSSLQVGAKDLGKLQEVPAAALLEAAQSVSETTSLTWRPTEDGVAIPCSLPDSLAAGCARDIPILIGCNLNECTLWTALDSTWTKAMDDDDRVRLFVKRWGPIAEGVAGFYTEGKSGIELSDSLTQMRSYQLFGAPIQKLVRRQIGQGPVWVYRFDWPSTAFGGVLKACHSLEIPFVFNTISEPQTVVMTGDSPDRAGLANQLHHAWIAFAHRGDPNTPEIPHWPQYDLAQRATMLFHSESRVENDPYGDERRVWERAIGE